MLSLAAQSDVRPRASVLKFCYLPVANGGLAAVPNGAINGDLRLILLRRGPHYHKSLTPVHVLVTIWSRPALLQDTALKDAG